MNRRIKRILTFKEFENTTITDEINTAKPDDKNTAKTDAHNTQKDKLILLSCMVFSIRLSKSGHFRTRNCENYWYLGTSDAVAYRDYQNRSGHF